MLDNHIALFLRAKEASNLTDPSLDFYRNVLAEFCLYSSWPPTPDSIEDYLIAKRVKCNDTTVASAYSGIRAFINWLYNRELIPNNPLKQIDPPTRPKLIPKAASVDTFKQLFATIASHLAADDLAVRDLALFRLAYDTGARASELSSLLLIDLELSDFSILIRRGKGRKDRKVYFGRKCKTAIELWLEVHPGHKNLFANYRGGVFTRKGIYRCLQKWGEIAGVKLSVHQIRHSYATHALRRGIDLEHIQRQLGHSDISTTAIYLAAEDAARRAAHQTRAPGDIV